MLRSMIGLLAGVAGTLIATSASSAPRSVSVPQLKAAVLREQPRFLTTLEELVNIDSASRDPAGLIAAATFLEARLKALGGEVRQEAVPPSPGKAVIATFHGSGTSTILLIDHYDTVYPPGSGRDWKFANAGNRLTGPGVQDAKGGVVTMLSALAVLKTLNFRGYRTITVMFTPDEEIGSPGSHDLITRMAAQHDVTLSGEPGGPQRVLATSGTAQLRLSVEGVASHAGVAPEAGRNALVVAADIVGRTRDWSVPGRGLKFNWTIFNSGETRNIIPAKALASADIRYVERSDLDALMLRLKPLSELPAVAGTKVTFDLVVARPSLIPTPASRRIAAVAQAAGQEIGYPLKLVDTPFGGASDAAFAGLSGKPVVESFGVGGEHAHTLHQEYANTDSIVPGIYILTRTILNLSTARSSTASVKPMY